MKKYLSVLRINWIQALEYRSNAVIGLFAILSGLFIEYQIWDLIYNSYETSSKNIINGQVRIGGFLKEEMIAFIFLSIIVGQLKSSWVTSSNMIAEIREGKVSKYLTRPISYFWYYFNMFVGVNSLFYFTYFFLISSFAIFYPEFIFPSFASLLGFIISLLISIYISYCIYFIMVCFAFWFGEVRSIVIAYNVGMLMFGGQYLPVRLFPEPFRSFIEYSPINFLINFPVTTAIEGITNIEYWFGQLLLSIFWCFLLTLICKLIYYKGTIRYEAFGQ